MCFGMVFFYVFILLGFVEFLGSVVYSLQVWENGAIISSNVFHPYPSWDPSYKYVRLLVVLIGTEALFIFLSLFFFLCYNLDIFYGCVFKFTDIFFFSI